MKENIKNLNPQDFNAKVLFSVAKKSRFKSFGRWCLLINCSKSSVEVSETDLLEIMSPPQ